jgi:hypothetical protein
VSESVSPSYLPWLRQGLGRGIGDVDTRGPLALRPAIEASITVEDSRAVTAVAASPLTMLGPGDVVGIDPAQIVRREPVPGATDVDYSLLPAVEFAVADLPWLLTPAAPDADEALRPWLVLVCVEDRSGVEYDPGGPTGPVLRVSGEVAATELPDLAESWAWAHVQSMVPAAEVASAAVDGGGAVLARLVAPRRLAPATTYRAAVVPAFDAGADAGLGRVDAERTKLRPAWDVDAPEGLIELPVYDSWTFTTATEVVNFEALCRRLQPDDTSVRLGFRAAMVADAGMLAPFSGDTNFEYEGALVDPDDRGQRLPEAARQWFQSELRRALDDSAAWRVVDEEDDPEPAGYDPETDDPVIGPPFYGSWAADATTVPDAGWLHDANLGAARRVAAGLGAQVVRDHDDEFLAAAWDQAGAVRALREECNRARLAAEVGRSHARRVASLSDAALLQVSARLHTFVRSGEQTLVQLVAGSAVVPTALVSPALLCQTRPGAAVGRRAARDRPDSTPLAARVTDRFVAASAPPNERASALEACARLGASYQRPGAVTTSTVFRRPSVVAIPDDLGGVVMTARTAVGHPLEPMSSLDHVAYTPRSEIVTTADDDVRSAAALVRTALDPMPSIVAGLQSRVTGYTFDAGAVPSRVAIGPRFPDPLFPKLLALGAEVVLPGVGAIADDRVRLVEMNEGWVAAFLVGANYEWEREALWNEYPADLGATAFSTFWPRVPEGATDLDLDIHEWTNRSTLPSHIGAAGSSTVLLVRGDLIRRFPGTEFFLVTPDTRGVLVEPDGTIPASRTTWPSFAGTLDGATVFVGFDVAPDIVRDEGRYVAIQEPTIGPRFGLDTAGTVFGEPPPAGWHDLSWGHVAASADALAALGNLRLATATWLDGVTVDGATWGRNGAHMARITFQQPFRLLLPATHLMPGPG